MKHVGQVIGQVVQNSHGSKQISSTPSITSEPRYTEDEKAKTAMFFARIQTIYGKGRCKTLFETDEELRVMRREWAKTLGQFAVEQLEAMMNRLKAKLAEGDPDFRFPDIARILALTSEPKSNPAHKLLQRGLPEPAWRKQERIERGRLAAKTCMAVMKGSACFVEDKPNDE